MQRPTTTDTMKQRDEELDKKIEALRRKNEALMKRYQEVEEDKKMAEQEGMALQSRKPEDLSITINKTTNQEPRVVMKKAGLSGGSPQEKSPRGGGEAADGGPTQFSMGRAKRRQLFVTMVGNNKGTRVVSESVDPTPPRPSGRKSSAEEDEENRGGSEPTRRGGRHAQSRKRTSQTQTLAPSALSLQEDGARQEGKAAAEESLWLSECDPYYQDAEWPEPQTPADLNIPTSREEQLEYLRWKAEREQIDRERVARHKNAKGQWRRAWDIDKPQLVFSDKPPGEAVRPQSNRGGRTPRKGHSKSTGESQGHPGRGRERRGKNAPAVVGSKAKGKDRLTGRARRWDTKDRDEEKQASETSLEEFLEELDALCDPENPSSEPSLPQNSDGTTAAAATDDESCVEIGSALETKQTDRTSRSPSGDDDTEKQGNPKVASPKGGEKKVRFSEELVQAAHVQRNPNTVTPETKGSLLKGAPSQMKVDVKTGAEENSTTTESEQTLTLTQTETQTPQQLEEADGKSQEDQNTPDVNATCTENCSPAEPTQRAEVKEKEDETKEDIQKALETDQDKDMEKTDDQPEGEAQEPPSSSAPDTAEQAKTAPSTETEGEASTQPDQAPVQQTPEHTKTSNSRTTEELIDSSLSVLSLDTGDAHPDRVTSTEKAREDGKVV